MVIFSLLIALLLDRALRNRGHWQLKPIAQSWRLLIQRLAVKYSWARRRRPDYLGLPRYFIGCITLATGNGFTDINR